MAILSIHDKEAIRHFTDRNPLLHLFERGDLDDFFWPYTTWYALREGDIVRQLALLYHAGDLPVLIAVPEQPVEHMPPLLTELRRLLPHCFYAHLHPEYAGILADNYQMQTMEQVYMMGLTNFDRLGSDDSSSIIALNESHLPALHEFYQQANPQNWFTPRMLATGRYYGIFEYNQLVSVAGVHAYSTTYNAAAIGNVATHPNFRGKGYAHRTCAHLCKVLLQDGITNVGLNVHVHNTVAITVYRSLGFESMAQIGTYMFTS
jgi:ribosomal protein S18 acetylase RimI-like enzyme